MRIGNLTLERPVFLAPMAGFTDLSFRLAAKRFGAGLVYTEMISAKGLWYGNGNTALLLATDAAEAPLAVQLFGREPELCAWAARRAEEAGAALIDINMGCPAPKIVKNGEGCALLKDLPAAARLIEAVAGAVKIPVTVKTRLGMSRADASGGRLAALAEAAGAAAVCIHGRARDEYYAGAADWGAIDEIARSVSIPVIGSGDVGSLAEARARLETTACSAVMIGRAAIGNPWVFSEKPEERTLPAARAQAEAHAEALAARKGEAAAMREIRKILPFYLKGFPGAARFKARAVSVSSLGEFYEFWEDAVTNLRPAHNM
ncbi:MAG: tRNA dihydrouridine synthase DusB [Clostridiales bacterium]|jgi:nifR3 family TIM-barrel protein|nr:tRNA dihydrouridine synthase DusB [Clostridiales bacterium]